MRRKALLLPFVLVVLLNFGAISAQSDIDEDEPETTTLETTEIDNSVDETLSVTTLIPQIRAVPLESSYEWNENATEKEITFHLPKGYKAISVTVVKTRFNDNSRIVITGNNDGPENGVIVANEKKSPMKMKFNSDQVSLRYIKTNITNTSFNDMFQVILEPHGPITTTIGPSSTTTPWPTPLPQDQSTLTVNISGRILLDFTDDVMGNFRECVRQMAIDYLDNEGVELTKNISIDNVKIAVIQQCPKSWPDTNTCVQIKFSLPIYHNETDSFQGYQLKYNHLFAMWMRNAKNSNCLNDNYFGIYLEPDVKKSIAIWAIVITFITVLFVVAIWMMRAAKMRFSIMQLKKHRHAQMSRMDETISYRSSKRTSTMSMQPHYFQEVQGKIQETPKFFDNNN